MIYNKFRSSLFKGLLGMGQRPMFFKSKKGVINMVKQTAGRDALNDFAPKFAELNHDVLFGEVWSREDKLSLKMRSIVTISALISKGIVDNSLVYHLFDSKKERRNKNRNGRDTYTYRILCRLA